MLKEILTDPLLIIGASVAAATNWITQWANPFVALIAGVGGLVVLGLTIAEKWKRLRMMDLEIKEKEHKP